MCEKHGQPSWDVLQACNGRLALPSCCVADRVKRWVSSSKWHVSMHSQYICHWAAPSMLVHAALRCQYAVASYLAAPGAIHRQDISKSHP